MYEGQSNKNCIRVDQFQNFKKLQVTDRFITFAFPYLNEINIHECFSLNQQKCESHKEKDLECTKVVKPFQTKYLKRFFYLTGSMGMRIIMQKND